MANLDLDPHPACLLGKAHAVPATYPCYYQGCKGEARWEVLDKDNFIVGRFCRKHSGDKVKELNQRGGV